MNFQNPSHGILVPGNTKLSFSLRELIPEGLLLVQRKSVAPTFLDINAFSVLFREGFTTMCGHALYVLELRR